MFVLNTNCVSLKLCICIKNCFYVQFIKNNFKTKLFLHYWLKIVKYWVFPWQEWELFTGQIVGTKADAGQMSASVPSWVPSDRATAVFHLQVNTTPSFNILAYFVIVSELTKQFSFLVSNAIFKYNVLTKIAINFSKPQYHNQTQEGMKETLVDVHFIEKLD